MGNDELFPKRKNPRYSGYDYSEFGYYFLTVCANERGEDVLCHISASAGDGEDGNGAIVELTYAGEIVKGYIESITDEKNGVKVETYVIMPDHVHLVVSIRPTGDGPMWASAPTGYKKGTKSSIATGNISQVIRSMKILSSKKIGRSIWQRSFYDRVIRRDEDMDAIFRYIAQNPARWLAGHCSGGQISK